jgi:capsular polysaccharide transport system permease protein
MSTPPHPRPPGPPPLPPPSPALRLAPPQVPRRTGRRRFPTLRAILALMLREMSTSYGRSPGGYAWAVAEPVLGVAFLSVVFSLIFRTPPVGQSFPMFYATGIVPFFMFNDLHNKVSQSLMYSRNLLTYPTVTFVDALIARFCVNAITQVMIAYILLAGAMVLFEGPMNVEMVHVVMGLIMASVLALGIGTLNAYVFSRIPTLQQAWSIMMRPLAIFSCVVIVYDGIPQPYRGWLWWNPILHCVGEVREGFYDSYDAYYVTYTYVFAVALSCMALGLLLLRAHHREILANN